MFPQATLDLEDIGILEVAVTGFDEQFSRGGDLIFADQDAPLECADRAFQHADVLIGEQMRDAGAVEQRLDRRNQHGVIGTDQFAHVSTPPSFFAWRA